MVTIGLVSDTHIQVRSRRLPEQLVSGLEGVDMILHAGDLEIIDVLADLELIAPTHAVLGNMDPSDLRGDLPVQRIIPIGDFTIGLIHGRGAPDGLAERIRGDFPGDIDCIVYGHSHQPLVMEKEGVLYVNPGSPTDTVFAPFTSFGLLRLDADGLSAEIIRI